MQNIHNKLDEIEAKIKMLIQQNEHLMLSNADLLKANKKLRTKSAQMEIELSNKEKHLKLALQNQGKTEVQKAKPSNHNARVKRQIDKYIREIDQCIEWLHNN